MDNGGGETAPEVGGPDYFMQNTPSSLLHSVVNTVPMSGPGGC